MILFENEIDILDIIEIMKNAFQVAINNGKNEIDYNDFVEAIEESYFPDYIITELKGKTLKDDNKKVFVIKPIK